MFYVFIMYLFLNFFQYFQTMQFFCAFFQTVKNIFKNFIVFVKKYPCIYGYPTYTPQPTHSIHPRPGASQVAQWLRICLQCRRLEFDPWVRKIPWIRKWQSFQYSCLGNPTNRGAWRATVHGVKNDSDSTFQLNESESHSVMSDSLQPLGLYSPWNSPGQNTGVGSLSLLQGIFPAQGSNPGFPHCRWILYQLSHKGSPLLLQQQ